jgi:hypothetical protein
MGGVSGLRSAFRENAANTQIARAMIAIEEGSTVTSDQVAFLLPREPAELSTFWTRSRPFFAHSTAGCVGFSVGMAKTSLASG